MPTWDQLFEAGGYVVREPSPEVERFSRVLASSGVRRVFDAGCGAGRHTVFLARMGFDVWGSDLAPHGVEHALRWLAAEGLGARLAVAHMVRQPFRDAAFDAAICVNVLHHGLVGESHAGIGELRRILKPGGLMLLTLSSVEDYKYGRGTEVEPNTFVLTSGKEAGVPHHFFTREEAEGAFSAFALRRLDVERRTLPSGLFNFHWVVEAQKA